MTITVDNDNTTTNMKLRYWSDLEKILELLTKRTHRERFTHLVLENIQDSFVKQLETKIKESSLLASIETKTTKQNRFVTYPDSIVKDTYDNFAKMKDPFKD